MLRNKDRWGQHFNGLYFKEVRKKVLKGKIREELSKFTEKILCIIGIYETCIECKSIIYGHARYGLCKDCYKVLLGGF